MTEAENVAETFDFVLWRGWYAENVLLITRGMKAYVLFYYAARTDDVMLRRRRLSLCI